MNFVSFNVGSEPCRGLDNIFFLCDGLGNSRDLTENIAVKKGQNYAVNGKLPTVFFGLL